MATFSRIVVLSEVNIITVLLYLKVIFLRFYLCVKEALAKRRIFSLVDMIAKAKFSNSPNDFKIHLFG